MDCIKLLKIVAENRKDLPRDKSVLYADSHNRHYAEKNRVTE